MNDQEIIDRLRGLAWCLKDPRDSAFLRTVADRIEFGKTSPKEIITQVPPAATPTGA